MRKIIEKIKSIFSIHCPECRGQLKLKFADNQLKDMVYVCEKCGKKWVSL